ncbi:hypothetical protein VE01_04076 [Pseudogymnoascus verrucosus]|uniref:Beta-glucuronidase C-terminal domain-containing protein n=1 Tax=Pseudogymnoascus verrucosus TaxID=342668 RepID=A0A1B8GLL6_9PEZI|nr:uncharacterized protein VE01_04076 [Pseudogymnoascus verrucosus]OBT96722.1 hypothetical protein VE01_04076 [Pseudogymnoascus verrucosus]
MHLSKASTIRPADVAVSTVIKLSAQANIAARPIPKDIASLSIEFCYVIDYLRDVDSPNVLSLNLLQNIEDLVSNPLVIRLGRHTQDAASFCAGCLETLNNTFTPSNDEAIATSYNKNLFTEFIFGLNLGGNDVSIPLAEVKAAEKYMHPSRLRAYELGNEPDFYGSQRPKPWNLQTYVAQQEDWLDQLAKKTAKGFSIRALAQLPVYQGNFSLDEIVALGLPKKVDYAVSLSDHTYPYSMCDPERAKLVSLPNLMNHTALVEFLAQWDTEIKAAEEAGVPFLMGETGSVSCHGKRGVSNTLGAALWELDYMLHGATIGIGGVYFHMGTPFYYSAWQPVAHNGEPAAVYPTYYSMLFMATALALKEPYIASLPSADTDLAYYGIYEGAPSAAAMPQKLIILNMSFLSSNNTGPVTPAKAVDVSQIVGKRAKAPVEFLAVGRLADGEIAHSISAATIDRVDAKIAGWKEKAGATRKGGEALWTQPGSKKTCCVAVKWSRVTDPRWPTNDYHNPADANPTFACPICVGSFTPCVWTHKDFAAEARVLPLPPGARAPGATPQTEGFYVRVFAQ